MSEFVSPKALAIDLGYVYFESEDLSDMPRKVEESPQPVEPTDGNQSVIVPGLRRLCGGFPAANLPEGGIK